MENLNVWEEKILPALTEHLEGDRNLEARGFLNAVLQFGATSNVSETHALPIATYVITEHSLAVDPEMVAAELHTFLGSGIVESFEAQEDWTDGEAERLSLAGRAFIETYQHFFA